MSIIEKYSFYDKVVLRTPSFQFSDKLVTENDLRKISKENLFLEAIYLASPVLYDEIEKWFKDEIKVKAESDKILLSLLKYYLRIQSRCTPFGLFANTSVGKWSSDRTNFVKKGFFRKTRLDMNYVCSLIQNLNNNPEIRPLLKFFPNNSIYFLGDEVRYIEYKYLNSRRIHQISCLKNAKYLITTLKLAKYGTSIKDLANNLLDEGVTLAESEHFINELIDNQVLTSELEPSVTGSDLILNTIKTLTEINKYSDLQSVRKVVKILEKVNHGINEIDKNYKNTGTDYKKVKQLLSELNSHIDESKLFQTDLFRENVDSNININFQRKLIDGLNFINKLFKHQENINLINFKDKFLKKYENEEIPLLQALDTESGVSYIGNTKMPNILIDDLILSEPENLNISWNMVEETLLIRLVHALNNKEDVVIFTDDDIRHCNNVTDNFPDTFAIKFSIIDNENIHLQPMGGSSSASLLGRFASGSENINEIVKDITEHEENLSNDKILAEIVHLPESRVGNILFRPSLRNYEIDYLAKSTLPEKNQIHLDDLLISIKGNRIVLKSKRLNKEIVPRLTTAHNYSFNSLPVYQFLCDLQTQYYDKSSYQFTWGRISSIFKFLPRAVYKNIILARAKWRLRKEDYNEILGKDISIEILTKWRTTWKIPRSVVIVEGDNELLIDFSSPLSTKLFLNEIKKKDKIELEEFLYNQKDLIIKDSEDIGYTNEFLAFLIRKENNSKIGPNVLVSTNSEVQRSYFPGSNWIYFKIYCGERVGDKVLSDILLPLCDKLRNIDKYFFIRFNDPGHHIRFRLLINDTNKIGEIILIINNLTKSYADWKLIENIQIETYKREIERYGANTMELSESMFFNDSAFCLNVLNLIDLNENNPVRWQIGIRAAIQLLNDFNFSDNEKYEFFNSLSNSFFNEHGGRKELRIQLDKKYRLFKKDIEEVLDESSDDVKEILPLINLLKERSQKNATTIVAIKNIFSSNQNEVDLNYFLASHIHMMMNRLFVSRQRTNEFVLYDFLTKYYKSKVYKTKEAFIKN